MESALASHPLSPPQPFKRLKGRHIAFTVHVPDDFVPADCTDVPGDFSDPEVLANRLSLSQAVAVVRDFNRGQLANHLNNRKWAVLVFRPKKGGAS